MAFTSSRQSSITNQEIKEEKEVLIREMQGVKKQIIIAQKEKKQYSDLNDEITQAKKDLSDLESSKKSLIKECEGKRKDVESLKTEYTKTLRQLGVAAESHTKKSDEIIEKNAALVQLEKKMTSIQATLEALHNDKIQREEDIVQLGLTKASLEIEIASVSSQIDDCVALLQNKLQASEQLDQNNIETQKKIELERQKLIEIQIQITEALEMHGQTLEKTKQVVLDADQKAADILEEARKYADAKKLELEQREGDISFAKGNLKLKQEKLKEIKLELEEHTGQKINIVVPN